MGPDVARRADGILDHRAPLILDAESATLDDLSDLPRSNTALSRSFEKRGKQSWFNRDDGPRAGFGEERIFGGAGILCYIYDHAKLGRTLLCPCRGGREAAFREGDGKPPTAQIGRGLHTGLGGESNQAINEPFFGGEINRGGLTRHDCADRLRILA